MGFEGAAKDCFGHRRNRGQGPGLQGSERCGSILASIPEDSVEKVTSSIGLDIELASIWKRANVDKYEKILSTSPVMEEVRELVGNETGALRKASWAILDTFIFAGGLSVPNSILHAMASYYDGFAGKQELDIHEGKNLKLLVLEALRRFPPVSSVPIMDARDHHRSLAFVAASGYEESVYGPDVKDFKIRGDLQWYHERSLSFAEPALPINEDSPETARICPGRSLAVAMAAAWLEALDLEKWCVDVETPIKSIPLEYGNFELVRIGSPGALCFGGKGEGSSGRRSSLSSNPGSSGCIIDGVRCVVLALNNTSRWWSKIYRRK